MSKSKSRAVGFLLIGAGLFAVAVILPFGLSIYRTKLAIRAIEQIGGICHTEPGGPEWLRYWLGDTRIRLFDSVWQVDLSGTKATDEDVSRIAVFTKIRTLDLGDSRVTSHCLYHFRGLPDLALIHLNGSQINDDGLEYLTLLPALAYLDLDNTSVTDKCLIYLKHCARLECVSLEGTQLTEAGLEELQRFKPGLLDTGLDGK